MPGRGSMLISARWWAASRHCFRPASTTRPSSSLGLSGAMCGNRCCAGWRGSAGAAATIAELQAMPEVRLLPGTTVLGYHDDNYLIAAERVGEGLGPAA